MPTQLHVFSAEDTELIVSLPYRAALNVSYAEDEDGEQDDELEMRALETSIGAFAKQQEGSDLNKEIAAEILNSKDQWEKWSQGVFNIEPSCEKAVLALKVHATDAEIKSYIKMVVEISTTVAQAFGEFGQGAEKPKGFFNSLINNLKGMSADNESHPMNVSAAEDSAISRITQALKKHA